MIYSEAAYFDGDHCSHCATRDEFIRLARIRRAWVNAEIPARYGNLRIEEILNFRDCEGLKLFFVG